MIALNKKVRTSIDLSRLLILLFISSVCVAQTTGADSTSSVSGRVTVGGKATAGIGVLARITDSPFENRTVARSITDDEGNYHISGLAPGRYTITPVARAFLISGNDKYEQPGQPVNVAQNESITKIDFALVRGGVITGRVTDPDGRPIIGEQISVTASRGADSYSATSFFSEAMYLTDDRGVYRIYGISPGSYRVSVGRAVTDASAVNVFGTGGSQYTRTFYPGVVEESKATSLEVVEGGELLNIDLTPGKTVRGFSVSGRVVDADSNQPVAKAVIAYAVVSGESQALGAMNFTGMQSDANGKFRMEGLDPGHYAVFTMSIGQENSYSDPAPFFISSGDVSGIEIKVRRGATIEGVAVIENNTDSAAATLLQSISVYAYVSSTSGTSAPAFSRAKINPDGSFQFTGLAPGKATVHMIGYPSPPQGLELMRTEHLGQEQPNGIDVTTGARVTGVRLVFTYSTGKIRGELKIDGRDWPDNLPVLLAIHTVEGAPRSYSRNIEVDARGHFLAENIPAGSYELTLRSTSETPAFEPELRELTVANGVEVPVTIVINLAP